jgi:hypothetical protein
MELNLSKEDVVFRDAVRSFIAENYPVEMRVPNPETDLTKEQSLLWHRILYKKGSTRRAGSRRTGRKNTAAPAGPSPSATFSSRRLLVPARCRRLRSALPWSGR